MTESTSDRTPETPPILVPFRHPAGDRKGQSEGEWDMQAIAGFTQRQGICALNTGL